MRVYKGNASELWFGRTTYIIYIHPEAVDRVPSLIARLFPAAFAMSRIFLTHTKKKSNGTANAYVSLRRHLWSVVLRRIVLHTTINHRPYTILYDF